MLKLSKGLNQPSESTPVFDHDVNSEKPVKCILVIREGDVAVSSLHDGRYGFFGDMNAVNARILYGITQRILQDQAWFEEHLRWVANHASVIDKMFRKDIAKSAKEEGKKLN